MVMLMLPIMNIQCRFLKSNQAIPYFNVLKKLVHLQQCSEVRQYEKRSAIIL